MDIHYGLMSAPVRVSIDMTLDLRPRQNMHKDFIRVSALCSPPVASCYHSIVYGTVKVSIIMSYDFQNRIGSRHGGGGVGIRYRLQLAGASETNVDRRERLRKLALETIDLAKDPYILRTHLGTLECRLCLTLHTNEGSYLAHTQGKKHQTNLARRAAKENKEQQLMIQTPFGGGPEGIKKKQFIKIGRPGYKVTKVRDPQTARLGLLFQVMLPEIKEGERPRKRFMSSFEQRKEVVNRSIQYLLVAAEPYETIAFAIPSKELVTEEEDPDSIWENWDPDSKVFSCQFLFR
ncbi:hypothetical protein HD553DRAFT_117027 [Filobasidium floriforme]|uniref:uncharacterized protein n=1 Tax=Filobasidium floriforme TaxID=5210 RepID=UPI001E8EAD8D|nr:uncharacterized protein HD553DRAFT_117027 [Filobasidium floriforme]KAH8080638.1 hypothetical protein HD553DRAFT_117027 [Filobasidium floriforme]